MTWPSNALVRAAEDALAAERETRGPGTSFLRQEAARNVAREAVRRALAEVPPGLRAEAVRDWEEMADWKVCRCIAVRARQHAAGPRRRTR
jgi:hypothetical protein